MRYILTLLKDLPEYPAGTKFKYIKEFGVNFSRVELRESVVLYDACFKFGHFYIPEEIIDDPEWIKKEQDFSHSVDLKCPICGETRGHIFISGYREGNRDDGYFNTADVYFEYDCGHEVRELYKGGV